MIAGMELSEVLGISKLGQIHAYIMKNLLPITTLVRLESCPASVEVTTRLSA
jgi:hypothetical protein